MNYLQTLINCLFFGLQLYTLHSNYLNNPVMIRWCQILLMSHKMHSFPMSLHIICAGGIVLSMVNQFKMKQDRHGDSIKNILLGTTMTWSWSMKHTFTESNIINGVETCDSKFIEYCLEMDGFGSPITDLQKLRLFLNEILNNQHFNDLKTICYTKQLRAGSALIIKL